MITIKKLSVLILIVLIILVITLTNIPQSSQSLSTGYITLSFDDGWRDNYTNAWAEMKNRNMKAVFNIVTVLLDDPKRLNIPLLLELQAEGNEIVSHSHNHPTFASLTEAEIRYECETSKQILLDNGINVKDFAYPGGNKDSTIDLIVSEYYRTGRYGWGLMDLPYSNWHIYGSTSYGTTDAEDLTIYKSIIDEVAATGKWTLLYFHSVPDVQTNSNQISRVAFAEVLDYIIEKNVQVVTMDEALNMGVEPPPEPPEEPPSEIPSEMSAEDWRDFWDWLKSRQASPEWGDYLEGMLERWKNLQ